MVIISKPHQILTPLVLILISGAFSWNHMYTNPLFSPVNPNGVNRRHTSVTKFQRFDGVSLSRINKPGGRTSARPCSNPKSNCSFSHNPRIIGGSHATRHQFPFMVAVYLNGKYLCGGAIVSPALVISAAHCYSMPEYNIKLAVRAGMLIRDEDHPDIQEDQVVEIVRHPKYRFNGREGTLVNDVALLRLNRSLSFNEAVRSINLPSPDEEFSGTVELLGWGYTTLNPPTMGSTLQFIRAPLIPLEECKQVYEKLPHYNLCQNTVCTLPDLSQHACNGDSGSPLVQNGVLVGVASWGDDYCGIYSKKKVPDVFARVSRFIGFIEKGVKGVSRKQIYTRS